MRRRHGGGGSVVRRVGAALAALVVAAALAACGVTIRVGGGRQPDAGQRSAVAATTVGSLQEYWAQELPALYDRPYQPLDAARVRGLLPSDGVRLRCGGSSFSYRDVQGNAFAAPCPQGITVLWDEGQLLPQLTESFGPMSSAVVLAHEWGHVAQFQAGVRLRTVYLEQQADCFAGAWVAAVRAAPPPDLAELAEESGQDTALATVIAVRDPVGTDPSQESAHGSGFDRVRSFQEGVDRGAEFCAGFAQSPPTLVEFPFRTVADAQSGGNLPLEQLLPLVTADLDAFFAASVPGFEPLGTVSSVDQLDDVERENIGLLQEIGDSAPAELLALRWATAAQEALGAETAGEGAALQRTCFTGGWLATLLAGDPASGQELQLSPGDLDEAILALLSLAQVGSPEVGGAETRGYELVTAFQQGVLQGFGACAGS